MLPNCAALPDVTSAEGRNCLRVGLIGAPSPAVAEPKQPKPVTTGTYTLHVHQWPLLCSVCAIKMYGLKFHTIELSVRLGPAGCKKTMMTPAQSYDVEIIIFTRELRVFDDVTGSECYEDNGSEYSGFAHTSVSGHECQKWTEVTPHQHRFLSLDSYPLLGAYVHTSTSVRGVESTRRALAGPILLLNKHKMTKT